MRSHHLQVAGAAVAFLILAVSSSVPAWSIHRDEQPGVSCIRYWHEARYRTAGYDHLVHVGSFCPADVDCFVSTNVDPTPVRVTVPPNAQITVITRVGSPAREFTPVVACRLAP